MKVYALEQFVSVLVMVCGEVYNASCVSDVMLAASLGLALFFQFSASAWSLGFQKVIDWYRNRFEHWLPQGCAKVFVM